MKAEILAKRSRHIEGGDLFWAFILLVGYIGAIVYNLLQKEKAKRLPLLRRNLTQQDFVRKTKKRYL